MRNVTLLDLRLGHVQLTEEHQQIIRERVVPILADITRRILRERATARVAMQRVAATAEAGD